MHRFKEEIWLLIIPCNVLSFPYQNNSLDTTKKSLGVIFTEKKDDNKFILS